MQYGLGGRLQNAHRHYSEHRYNAFRHALRQAQRRSFIGGASSGGPTYRSNLEHDALADMGTLIEFVGAHPWLSLGVVGSLLAALFNEVRLRSLAVSALAPATAVQAINKGAAIFDLREPKAYGQGHIPNARNMRAAEVPGTPKLKSGKPVVLVCDNGSASGRLAQDLRKKGSEQVFSLKGGLAAWQRENLPVIGGR